MQNTELKWLSQSHEFHLQLIRKMGLASMLGKAGLLQPVAKLLNGVNKLIRLLTLLEGGRVHKVTIQSSNFACQGLHQHANGHSWGEGMGVDDQIWPAEHMQIQCHDVILPLLWLLLSCSIHHTHVTDTLGVLRLVQKLTDYRTGQAFKVGARRNVSSQQWTGAAWLNTWRRMVAALCGAVWKLMWHQDM